MLPALAEGGGGLLDQLGINPYVIAVQVVIFLTALWVLRRFLFGPVTEFTRRREEEISEATREIEKNRAEVERLSAEYRKDLAEIEKRAHERLQQAIKEGREAKAKIIAEAEQEARAQLEKAREEIEKEKGLAREALRAEVKRLALEAAERLTGRPPGAEDGRIVDEILSKERQ